MQTRQSQGRAESKVKVQRRERLWFGARPGRSPGCSQLPGGAGRPGETPPICSSEPPPGTRQRAGAAATPRCQLLELTWNFPGTRRRRRPHLTEHLQVVLVLVQIQHLGLEQGGGAAAAQEGGVDPRAFPTGAPSREAGGARRRCQALALHPESARPARRGCQPLSPELAHWLPRILHLPGRPRSSPSPAAQTRNCRGERRAGSSPPGLGPAGDSGVGLAGPGEGGERAAVRCRKGEHSQLGRGRPPTALARGLPSVGFRGGRGLGLSDRANHQLQGIRKEAGRQPTHPAQRKSPYCISCILSGCLSSWLWFWRLLFVFCLFFLLRLMQK